MIIERYLGFRVSGFSKPGNLEKPGKTRKHFCHLTDVVDEASDDEDVLQVARYILESLATDKPDVLEQLMATLTSLSQDQLVCREL